MKTPQMHVIELTPEMLKEFTNPEPELNLVQEHIKEHSPVDRRLVEKRMEQLVKNCTHYVTDITPTLQHHMLFTVLVAALPNNVIDLIEMVRGQAFESGFNACAQEDPANDGTEEQDPREARAERIARLQENLGVERDPRDGARTAAEELIKRITGDSTESSVEAITESLLAWRESAVHAAASYAEQIDEGVGEAIRARFDIE